MTNTTARLISAVKLLFCELAQRLRHGPLGAVGTGSNLSNGPEVVPLTTAGTCTKVSLSELTAQKLQGGACSL